jgi:hypothetical protein
MFSLKTMKRYFRLKRCAKYYKLVKGVIINESQPPNSLLTVAAA